MNFFISFLKFSIAKTRMLLPNQRFRVRTSITFSIVIFPPYFYYTYILRR